jgi:flagellar hook assembly protein FlgD
LLINQGNIYFGNTDGGVFKKSYPISSEARNELPMWGTFQGNNQRTGNQSTNQLSISDKPLVPKDFILYQNYPNPFNPTTQIKYDLPSDSYVNISIYDVMGRKIKLLFNNKQTSGYHSLRWDATNDIGEGVSAGMYIYTIQAGEYRSTKKMVLLK